MIFGLWPLLLRVLAWIAALSSLMLGTCTRRAAASVTDLLAAYPRVPQPLDKELLRAAEKTAGVSLRGNDTAHREVRKIFWTTVRGSAAAKDDP